MQVALRAKSVKMYGNGKNGGGRINGTKSMERTCFIIIHFIGYTYYIGKGRINRLR